MGHELVNAGIITAKQLRTALEAQDKMEEAYKNSADKRIIVLDKNYPWDDFMIKYEEPLFVVYPLFQ